MPNIEKNQEQYNDLSTLESKASNLTPDQKKEVGTNVDVEKALLDWRDTGAYKVLPPSYEEFVQDLKKVDYTPDNKYIQQIKAYVFAKEKVSGDLIKACKQSQNDIIVLGSKSIPLQSIYGALSKSAILAYKQSNTGGIASADTLPEEVTLGDMKLLDHINTMITTQKYKNMMQIVQRCRDDDRFIKSEYLSEPSLFYQTLSDDIGHKNNNKDITYPIVDLCNTLLLGKQLKITTGGGLGEQGNNFMLAYKEDKKYIDHNTVMTIKELQWDNISPNMNKYIKPKLENLFPYHEYNYKEYSKYRGKLMLSLKPSEVFKKLKADRDTRYKNRIEATGVGATNTLKVIENNFDLLHTRQREILSLCLSNTRQVPTEVFDVQEKYNTKVLTEMGVDGKVIPKPFGDLGSERVQDIITIYTADQIKNWKDGEASTDKTLAGLYTNIQNAEKYGKLIRFEPSNGGYKLVIYNTGYSDGGKAREVNFLNRWKNVATTF